ncbi:putative c2h2 type zinc finger domain containing protein [Erysiphe neolycopersici]|uniref:Putative c2h2 type zinc finger domain containing protein n=1 Tax=Erysiphe neolycopersici TaxID=212602 RepID=A0A420I5B5_9PEZI|nr:putative c2h2 type zinc finger domain containing protein [Erysiphe neolycopersici]
MPLPRDPGCKVSKTKTTSSPAVASKQCSYCDRKFSKVEHLKRHERSHTGERPYTCPKCQKSFSRSDVLIRHLKNHPRISDQEIENGQSEKVVDTKKNLLPHGALQIPTTAESLIAPLVTQASTEYSSQAKQDNNQQLSMPRNEAVTLDSQGTCGLDQLATLASRQDYGGDMMDTMLPAESHSTLHEISYDNSSNANQSYNWNQDHCTFQLNFQIDPNLDPRLTQPENFLTPSDQKKSEVKIKYESSQSGEL